MARVRRQYYYRGRVQGVGFRATARDLARRFTVAGTVRNLDDGRVEVVAEGNPAELDAFEGALTSAFGGKVRGVDRQDEPPGDPPLSGFEILA